MRTELRVDGANCPTCLNELLDHLCQIDGVTSVSSSIGAGCIAVDHDDLDPEALTEGVQLHGVALSSNEIVMTSIDPLVAKLHCNHPTQLDQDNAAGPV